MNSFVKQKDVEMNNKSNQTVATTTIIRGLPGSGKTTYAKKYFPNSLIIEGDQLHANPDGTYEFDGTRVNSGKYILAMLKTAYRMGVKHVVVTVAHTGLYLREIMDLAKKHGTLRVAWMDYNNGDTSQNNHAVPDDVIATMKKRFFKIEGETYIVRTNEGYKLTSQPPKWYLDIYNKTAKEEK
jgi:predicted kinase